LSGNPGIPVKVWIDDLDVKFLDQSLMVQDSTEVVFKPLFKDNFNRYERALFPGQSGWMPGQDSVDGYGIIQGKTAQEGGVVSEKATPEILMSGSTIDDAEYASSSKSFKLEDPDNEAGLVVKRFSLPVRTPFCVSAENFAISAVNQDSRGDDNRIGLSGRERVDEREGRRGTREESKAGRRGSGMSSTVRRTEAPRVERRSVRRTASGGAKSSQLLSGVPAGGAFYIYSFDGRLLAEYNILGGCVRDYVYFGGQLIAEYQTTGEDLYYYTSDQINSTRIVTDSTGTVVYSAAHNPYGGIQKTWTNTFDPALKFSGKEHDEESDLDYFGARYYDRTQYRFISVDPVTTVGAAVYDPQSWNLYSYCGNNPLVYVDSTGLYKTPVHYGLTYSLAIQAHFTPAEARIIASANNDVDSGFLSSFHLRSSLQESMESNYLHFPNSAQLASARMGAMNASNLAELGFYLHTIQDSYSHSGSIPVTIFTPVGPIEIQVPVNKITHSLLTAMAAMGACNDPDDPMTNPSNYAKMRSETFYALLFWRANYIRFSNDVIFQTPCF